MSSPAPGHGRECDAALWLLLWLLLQVFKRACQIQVLLVSRVGCLLTGHST